MPGPWPPLDADLPINVEDRDNATAGTDDPSVAAGAGYHANLHNKENQTLRDIRDHLPTDILKPTDQTVTNSIALVNDTALLFAMAANTLYIVTAMLLVDAPVANDVNVAFTIPAGATMLIDGPRPANNITTAGVPIGDGAWNAWDTSGTARTVGGCGAGTPVGGLLYGWVQCGATPGNFQVQFAQAVAGAGTSAIMKAGSILTYRKSGA